MTSARFADLAVRMDLITPAEREASLAELRKEGSESVERLGEILIARRIRRPGRGGPAGTTNDQHPTANKHPNANRQTDSAVEGCVLAVG